MKKGYKKLKLPQGMSEKDFIYKLAVLTGLHPDAENGSVNKGRIAEKFSKDIFDIYMANNSIEGATIFPEFTLDDYLNGWGVYTSLQRDGEERIAISDDIVSDAARNPRAITNVIETIGHEGEHWQQSTWYRLLDRTSYQEIDFTEDELSAIASFTEDGAYRLEADDFEIIKNFLDPDGKEEIPNKQTSYDFYKYVATGFYANMSSEKEARQAGYEYTISILEFVKNSSFASPELKAWATTELERYIESLPEKEETFYRNTHAENYDFFIKNLDYNDEDLIKFMRAAERGQLYNSKTGATIELRSYKFASILKYLLSNQTLDEKLKMFEVSLLLDFNTYGNLVLQSIIYDPQFDKRREEIQNKICSLLINGKISDDVFKIVQGADEEQQSNNSFVKYAYDSHFGLILTPKQQCSVFTGLIKQGKFAFANRMYKNIGQSLSTRKPEEKEEVLLEMKNALIDKFSEILNYDDDRFIEWYCFEEYHNNFVHPYQFFSDDNQFRDALWELRSKFIERSNQIEDRSLPIERAEFYYKTYGRRQTEDSYNLRSLFGREGVQDFLYTLEHGEEAEL